MIVRDQYLLWECLRKHPFYFAVIPNTSIHFFLVVIIHIVIPINNQEIVIQLLRLLSRG